MLTIPAGPEDVVPAGDLGHVDARLERLGNDRDLLRLRPVPTPLRACYHLDPPRSPGRSFIATLKLNVKSIPAPTR